MRYLAVHDDLKGVPGVIKGMGMRLNAGSTGVATDITMEVVISTAITTSATIDATFDNNHGTDKATVVPANSLFQFAAYPAVTRGPAPFTYQVPFNNPFPFVGAGPICWEFRIASRTNATAFSLDAGSGTFSFFSQAIGLGCLATGRTVRAATTAALSAANLTVSVTNFAAGGIGLAVIGFNDVNWSGIPLPLLVPGSDTAPSGACNIWSDMILMQAFVASATGAGSSVFAAVPASPAWLGLRAYSWGLGIDAAANPLGVVTTNYRELNWGDALPVLARRNYAFNNVNAPTGSVDATGIIVEFVY
jgi:hypothetical protein